MKHRKASAKHEQRYILNQFSYYINQIAFPDIVPVIIYYFLLSLIPLTYSLTKFKKLSNQKALIIEFALSYTLLLFAYKTSILLTFDRDTVFTQSFYRSIFELLIPTVIFFYEIPKIMGPNSSCEIATCGYCLAGVLTNLISISNHLYVSFDFKSATFFPYPNDSFLVKIFFDQLSIFSSSTILSLLSIAQYSLEFVELKLIFVFLKKSQEVNCDLTVDSKHVSQDLFDM